uniref:Uncharacterized protein n=1 Tax=Onchocerca volvulus TaxID=6282 RepID=A0A8R1XQ47_ONCVO
MNKGSSLNECRYKGPSENIRKAKKAKELFKNLFKMKLREFHANDDINKKNEQKSFQTKRQILQFYAAIYDLLGLLGPIILPWKLLIQDLWKKEMRCCLELEKAFKQFDVMEVSRWTPQEYSEIHLFVDASEKAIGLAIYACRSSSKPCKLQLIYGNTKLVPKREKRNQSANVKKLNTAKYDQQITSDQASRGLLP